MRILMVAPISPFPPIGGAPMRNYQLLRQLSRHHAVSVIAGARPEWPGARAALSEFCDRVSIVDLGPSSRAGKRGAQLRALASRGSYLRRVFSSGPMQRALDGMLASGPFDILQLESALVASLRFGPDARLVLDEHNIEYEVLDRVARMERSPLRKLYNRLEYWKTRREERTAWCRVDGCTVTSERETAIVHDAVPTLPVRVVPNGVDLEYFAPAAVAADPDSIVFTGRLDYRPNADAVLYFVREIMPRILSERPSTIFTIVGMGVPDEIRLLAGPHVRVTGPVPDVRPFLARAAVAIAPLRMGGGTRLKLLEAMAMGKAIVSTSIGCEGLAVQSGIELLVGDDPDRFAGEVLRLLGDEPVRLRLGAAARQRVEAQYGWPAIARELEDFHRAIASRQAGEERGQLAPNLELSR